MTSGYYRTSSPVTALPMIVRWISDVPSKIVKLMEVGAVCAGRWRAGRTFVSTYSAPQMRAPTVAGISGDSGHAIEDALNRLPDALLAGKPAASVTAAAGGPGEIEQVHSFGVVEPQACRTAETRRRHRHRPRSPAAVITGMRPPARPATLAAAIGARCPACPQCGQSKTRLAGFGTRRAHTKRDHTNCAIARSHCASKGWKRPNKRPAA
jgi:hypothetical protein